MANTKIQLIKEPPYGYETIIQMIPHRYPFLLIDRVVEVSGGSLEDRVGRTLRAIKNVTANEDIFNGHFPERPLLPGVIMIEIIAQAAALAAWVPKEGDAMHQFLNVSVDGAKFRRPVVPGDQLDIHVEVTKDRRSLIGFTGQIYVEGTKVSEGNLLAKVL